MLRRTGCQWSIMLIDRVHQVDPASGRVGFLAKDAIAGAGCQAKAAVDAAIDQLRVGWMLSVKSLIDGCFGCEIGSHKIDEADVKCRRQSGQDSVNSVDQTAA